MRARNIFFSGVSCTATAWSVMWRHSIGSKSFFFQRGSSSSRLVFCLPCSSQIPNAERKYKASTKATRDVAVYHRNEDHQFCTQSLICSSTAFTRSYNDDASMWSRTAATTTLQKLWFWFVYCRIMDFLFWLSSLVASFFIESTSCTLVLVEWGLMGPPSKQEELKARLLVVISPTVVEAIRDSIRSFSCRRHSWVNNRSDEKWATDYEHCDVNNILNQTANEKLLFVAVVMFTVRFISKLKALCTYVGKKRKFSLVRVPSPLRRNTCRSQQYRLLCAA